MRFGLIFAVPALVSSSSCTGTGELANTDASGASVESDVSTDERDVDAPTETENQAETEADSPTDADEPDPDATSETGTPEPDEGIPTDGEAPTEPEPEPPVPALPSPSPGETDPPSTPDEAQPDAGPDEPQTSDEAPGFFGDSRCTDEFLLCEDFESGEIDAERWQTRGTVSVSNEQSARGNYAARFTTDGNGLSMITNRSVFPAEGNSYYARIFVRFSELPTQPMWAHWSVSGAEGSQTDAEIRIGGQWDGQTNRFGVGTDYGPTGDWTNLDQDPEGNPEPVPEFEWVCLEWHNDGDSHESFFWWDDVEHPSLYTSQTEHGGNDTDYLLPEFESVWFGWWLYQADPYPDAYDVFIDEIVIDDEPIGCSR